jgi:hypothetical protein
VVERDLTVKGQMALVVRLVMRAAMEVAAFTVMVVRL